MTEDCNIYPECELCIDNLQLEDMKDKSKMISLHKRGCAPENENSESEKNLVKRICDDRMVESKNIDTYPEQLMSPLQFQFF